MANKSILLKKSPKIEFQFLNNGFQLTDEQTATNSGFYSYNELQSIELNKPWFPKVAKWLRPLTWIFNGVPFFPDAESSKTANVIIRSPKNNVGVWLTDTDMVNKAILLKKQLEHKTTASL